MAGKKVQVPVLGGLRKVITIPSLANPGTTITEFANQTISLAQLKAALGIQPAKPNTGNSSAAASLVPGPGLGGGGVMVGAVPIYLTTPIPYLMEEGGGGDGDPGPPGTNGATGAQGPIGPAVFFLPDDPQPALDAVPGAVGPPGTTGASGPVGPAAYLEANDGEDGWHAIPGVAGAPGAAGATGPAGQTVFLFPEDGADGDIGPPGQAGASSGGGSGAMTLLGSTTAGGAVASLTVGSIPATATHLLIIVTGRGDAVAAGRNVHMQFNADTGANYDSQITQSEGTTVNGSEQLGQTSMLAGFIAAASATSHRAGVVHVTVGDYLSTLFDKHITGTSAFHFNTASGGGLTEVFSAVWRPATPVAITSVTVFPETGNFIAGTKVSIYGLQ